MKLRYRILDYLNTNGSAYGWQISEGIGVRNSSVYTTLHRLQTKGMVTARWEGRRKHYEITQLGREALSHSPINTLLRRWKEEVCDKHAEVIPPGVHDWFSLWIGFTLALGHPELADYGKYMQLAFIRDGS